MTEKDIKRLNRKKLLKMLVEQGREVKRLQQELDEANKKLEDKEIRIAEAGTVAEAALSLNGVYEAVEAAAIQYMQNIAMRSRSQQEAADRALVKARREAETLLVSAQRDAAQTISAAQREAVTIHNGIEQEAAVIRAEAQREAAMTRAEAQREAAMTRASAQQDAAKLRAGMPQKAAAEPQPPQGEAMPDGESTGGNGGGAPLSKAPAPQKKSES